MADGDGWQSPWDPTGQTPIASPGLSQDDPLRSWFAQIQDPSVLQHLMNNDPEKFKDIMAQQGVPPPPGGWNPGGGISPPATPPAGSPAPTNDQQSQALPPAVRGVPPQAGGTVPALGFSDVTGQYQVDPNTGMPYKNTPGDVTAPIRTDQKGKIVGNITTPPPAQPLPPVTVNPPPQTAGPAVAGPPQKGQAGEDLEPPPGTAKEEQAQEKAPAPTDSNQKYEKAIAKFSDMLKGVQAPKPLTPPNIGAPQVRAHTALQGLPMQSLLGLAGQGPATQAAMLSQLLGRMR